MNYTGRMINQGDSIATVKSEITDILERTLGRSVTLTSWAQTTTLINEAADLYGLQGISNGMNGGLARSRINSLEGALRNVPSSEDAPHSVYLENQRVYENVYRVHSAAEDYSITRSNNGRVQKFDVQEGDKRPSDSGDVERSELSLGSAPISFGTEFWASWSFGLEPVSGTYPELGETWINLGQMYGDNGSPIISFLLRNDSELTIVTRSGVSGSPLTSVRYTLDDFVRGKLYNIVINGSCDSESVGFLKVWINGISVVDVEHVPIGYSDEGDETFWKFGVYRSTSAPERVGAWFCNMRFGQDDLSEKISEPDPINFGDVFTPMMTIDSLGVYGSTDNLSSYMFNDVPLGEEREDRVVAVTVCFQAEDSQTVSGVGIHLDGNYVPLDISRIVPTSPGTTGVVIASARVPTGAVGDIEVLGSGDLSACVVYPLRLMCLTSGTALSTDGRTSLPFNDMVFGGSGLVAGVSSVSGDERVSTWSVLDKLQDTTMENRTVGSAIGRFVTDEYTMESVAWDAGTGGPRAAIARWV